MHCWTLWRRCLLLAAALLVSGCVNVNSYVEPGHSEVGLGDIHSRAEPLQVSLQVKFMRNGAAVPENDANLRKLVSNVLYSTGVLKVVPADQAQATLKVTADNRYDPGKAMRQGFFAGLTAGLIGKTVRDRYVFTVILSGPHQPMRRGIYGDAIQTTLGHADAPVPARAIVTNDAYDVVVQQAVLSFLSDLQAAGDSPMPIGFVHRVTSSAPDDPSDQ